MQQSIYTFFLSCFSYIFLTLLSGCDGNSQIFLSTVDAAKKDIHSLEITSDNINTIIEVNETVQLSVIAYDANNESFNLDSNNIDWSLSCTEQGCATIDRKGKLTGVADGTATITASYGGFSTSYSLTISSAQLVAIDIEIAPTIYLCKSTYLKAMGQYEDDSLRDITESSNWSILTNSDHAQVVKTLDNLIYISINNNEPTTLSASYQNKGNGELITQSIVAQVTDTSAPTITISGASTLFEGTTTSFNAEGTFTDGSTQSLTYNLNWSSSDTSKLAFSNATTAFELVNRDDGQATAIAVGNGIVVNASCGLQKSNDLTINVEKAEVTGIAITRVDSPNEDSPYRITVSDEPVSFKAYAIFNSGTQASTVDITEDCKWSANDGVLESIYVGNTEGTDISREKRGNITGEFTTPEGKNTEVEVQYETPDSSGNRPRTFFQVIVE